MDKVLVELEQILQPQMVLVVEVDQFQINCPHLVLIIILVVVEMEQVVIGLVEQIMMDTLVVAVVLKVVAVIL